MNDLIKQYLLLKMSLPVSSETMEIDRLIKSLKKKDLKYGEVINNLEQRIKYFFQKQKITY